MDEGSREFAKWLFLIVLGCFVLDGIQDAWGEHRFIAAFAESIVAQFLYWAGPIGGAAGGLALAEWLRKRPIKIPGWIMFIAGAGVFVLVTLGVQLVGDAMPGVGWRMERMRQAEPDGEWDGRGYHR